MKKIIVSLFAGLLMLGFANGAKAANFTDYITVTAKIDGSDWFEMTGNEWRWQHRNYTIPEYHEGNDPTVITFGGNSQSFLSTWLHGYAPGAYSESNVVSGLPSLQSLFGSDVVIKVEQLDGRTNLALEQIPTSSNNYSFRIFINDDAPGGHDFYTFKISAANPNPVPEPASMLLGLMSLGGVFGLKKKQQA